MHQPLPTARLNVWARDLRKLRNLAAVHRLDLCFGSVRRRDGGFAFDAFVDDEQAQNLAEIFAADGCRCTLTAAHEDEAPEVSTTNRYATEVPRGVGIKR